MNFIENQSFNEYINSYKKLPLQEKKNLAEQQFEEIIAVLDQLNIKYLNKSEILFNRELLDLKKETSTESDFVEAMFVYAYSIKELVALLISNFSK